ncbi:ImmA/IrrE family metallo-endopeptidase [Paenibacillus sp. J31TS4]|uniref:ImmA/IrrE family metallo-endopeptidase n=1 Tax=Paenibacillus sp. J31TS4 TaxID=2807195 RepID=UPI001B2A1D0C|nr:ImmA/IrrE family metallo-endopeptidase [Paenibacillus sp. J31TS4]GIP38612.1 ImmA/IrrE family metallo-endopeptidase [Paenibacillus sp. J31TS4]
MIDSNIRKLVKKYNTNCPFVLAEKLNIMVEYRTLPPSCRGYYLYVRKRRFIAINKALPYIMQRFVCAHELGHDRLHKGFGHYFIEQNTLFNPGKFERQANTFAVRLLTYDRHFEEDESVESFCRRNDIPLEMVEYIVN